MKITTKDCVAKINEQRPGKWKRTSKTGNAETGIRRVFEADGQTAIVIEKDGNLTVEFPPTTGTTRGATVQTFSKYSSVAPSSKSEMEEDGKLRKKNIPAGETFYVVDLDDDGKVESVEDILSFPNGGTAYAPGFGEGYSSDTNLYLVDDVGNVWMVCDEPADVTEDADDYIDSGSVADLKSKGATVVLIHA
jgi:hypothetical protein